MVKLIFAALIKCIAAQDNNTISSEIIVQQPVSSTEKAFMDSLSSTSATPNSNTSCFDCIMQFKSFDRLMFVYQDLSFSSSSDNFYCTFDQKMSKLSKE